MPYIPQKDRKRLNGTIDKLAKQIVAISKDYTQDDQAFAGLINYSCTRLALVVLKLHFGKVRYWLIAILSGVFKNVADEFYRRIASSYENKKIKSDGDVDLYAELIGGIENSNPKKKA